MHIGFPPRPRFNAAGDADTVSIGTCGTHALSIERETEMANEATQVLANFAASLQYKDLPERAKESCKNLLLDALACAMAGGHGDETEQVAALAGALAQSRESSVIGGDKLSLAGATMLNGFLITAVTMCDTHRSTLTHVTPEVMPPAPLRRGPRRR